MSDLVAYTPPSGSELEQTWQLASKLARTEFVPKTMRGSPEAVLACMLTGRELGLPPMQALRDVYLVNGRPALSATIMVARVRAFGHRFRTLESTDHHATVQVHRKGEQAPEPPVTFTIEDAKRAKLISKDVWQAYPERMLWARAASACCRRDCPEALGAAVYTPEEIADFTNDPETDVAWGEVEVDRATGEVLEDSPTAGVVTTTPTPAVATTTSVPSMPSVPTLEQIKKVRTPEGADKLIRQAGEAFGELISRAVLALNTHTLSTREQARDWWSLASPMDRREVLEYAVELHDQQQHEAQQMSPAPAAPLPDAGDQTSDPRRAEREREGLQADSATTRGSDNPTLDGGDP